VRELPARIFDFQESLQKSTRQATGGRKSSLKALSGLGTMTGFFNWLVIAAQYSSPHDIHRRTIFIAARYSMPHGN